MLWVDKYRPRTVEQLSFHPTLNARLQKLAEAKEFPHLLFYGPSGAGKKTRVMALLSAVFGNGVHKLKSESRSHKITRGGKTTKTVEYHTISSSYHIEMNPSDAGNYDRDIVQHVIKEMAQSVPIDSAIPFKVILLNEVEQLSQGAQHALRRTMERYSSTCRLILCTNSTAKVMDPVRSRCLSIRVPAPSREELTGALQGVAHQEGLELSELLAQRVADASEQNARKAFLMLETMRVRQYPFNDQGDIPRTDWEQFISQIATEITQEQSPARLLQVRSHFYELIGHCIPPEVILKRLVKELLPKCDSSLMARVVAHAAVYEHRMHIGNKPIFHLEAFVAAFMKEFRGFILQAFS